MSKQEEKTLNMITNSPWQNTYWFARMLVDTDKYSAISTTKKSKISDLVIQLENLLGQKPLSSEERFKVCKDTLLNAILNMYKSTTKLMIILY